MIIKAKNLRFGARVFRVNKQENLWNVKADCCYKVEDSVDDRETMEGLLLHVMESLVPVWLHYKDQKQSQRKEIEDIMYISIHACNAKNQN